MSDWFENYFSVQVFFIVFRETIETAIIVSVLLAFIDQGFGKSAPVPTSTEVNATDLTINSDENSQALLKQRVYRNLVIQVWVGAVLGLLICIAVGSFFVYAFFHLGKDLWFATEKYWEATFSITASLIISVIGISMLRLNKMKKKWRYKIAKSIVETHKGEGRWGLNHLSRKYAIAVLPFITTLREGLEVVVFLGGIGASQPASSFPLPTITAVLTGSFVGWLMYRTGDHMSIQYFLIGSTCFLYLVAAGLMSRGVWFFELQQFISHVGQDVSEMGSGPGSYDITHSVWHVNCCNSQTDGPWMIFNALLGWQNSATYGSVIAYNFYWWVIILAFYSMWYKEKRGILPFIPVKLQKKLQLMRSVGLENGLVEQATRLYTTAYSEEEETRLLATRRHSGDSLNSHTPLISSN